MSVFTQMRALLLEGGLQIETPLPGQEGVDPQRRQNFATTLIQPDGDVLTAVNRAFSDREDLWLAHHENVRKELRSIRTVQAALDTARSVGRLAALAAVAYTGIQSVNNDFSTATLLVSLPLLCSGFVTLALKGIVISIIRREL